MPRGTLRAASYAGVKPEVDGTTLGSALASTAAMSVEELMAVLEEQRFRLALEASHME